MSNTRARLLISGRVQGVFYRAFVQETARALGLGGWARNLPDGRVEALFEGERVDIVEALRLCYQGPPACSVSDIEIEWEKFQGEFASFRITY